MSEHFEPRPYQRFAIDAICQRPAVGLFLDMGLGKTAITLTAINYLLYDSFDVSRVLVIAPLRVAESTWADEAGKWEELKDLRVVPVIGSRAERLAALRRRADVYTINRENVVWLVETYGRKWPFDMVVVDESSSFKSSASKRFRALRRVRSLIERMVLLTGTPAPNGLMDLWSQIYLLDMGKRLGRTLGEYRRRWFRPCGGSGYVVYDWAPLKWARAEITAAISDICVSMKSEDFICLPKVMYNRVKVRLSDEARALYKKMERDFILSLSGTEIVATTAATLTGKLIQLAGGLVYDEDGQAVEVHRAKLDALEELLGTLPGNVMVFYWYRSELTRLMGEFPFARPLKTADDIRDWNAGKIRLLLVHPASAGHGLNLQYGGSTIIWYSLTWSLELYQQANKRLHRSGQEHTVIIHHLICGGTIDEEVMDALAGKKAGQDAMLAAVRARIKEYGGRASED